MDMSEIQKVADEEIGIHVKVLPVNKSAYIPETL